MWLVYKKELLELVRDKRTLMLTILLPTIIFPILFFGLGKFSSDKKDEAETKEIKIAFVNTEKLVGLEDMFSKDKDFARKELKSDDYEELILSKELDFILVFPETSEVPTKSLEQESIKLYYKGSSSLDAIFKKRFKEILDSYNNVQRKELGKVFSLSADNVKAFHSPLSIEYNNYATKRETVGELAGAFAAYILILLAISGAMYPTLEIGVGEKERGTLETLLLTPMPKGQIVLAKFGVIFTTSFSTVAVTLLSYFFWTYIFTMGGKMLKLEWLSGISGLDLLLVGVLLLPLTSIFASIMLSASIYAKNMKEAQAYMSPIMLLGFLPVVVAFIPGMELNWQTAMIPITNVALAMKDLIKGTVDYNMIAVLLASTTAIAGVLLYFTTQFFKKEKVLFRS